MGVIWIEGKKYGILKHLEMHSDAVLPSFSCVSEIWLKGGKVKLLK